MAHMSSPTEALGERMMSSEDMVEQGVPRGEAQRIAVRASLQQVMEVTFARQARLLLCTVYILLIGMFGVLVWSFMSLERAQEDNCDQPLPFMVRLMYMILAVMSFRREFINCFLCYNLARDGPFEPLRVRFFKKFLLLTALAWPIVAAYFLMRTKRCDAYVVNAVEVILAYYVVLLVVLVIMPTFFLSIMLFLIRRGLVRLPRNERAAPEDTIERLPVVTFDADIFNDDAVNGYSTACPVCLENFDAESDIVRTPCTASSRGHAFHKECLRGWLNVSRNCPLCRTDLAEALQV